MAALLPPSVNLTPTGLIPPSVQFGNPPRPPPTLWLDPGPSGLENEPTFDILPSPSNPIGDNSLVILADNAQAMGGAAVSGVTSGGAQSDIQARYDRAYLQCHFVAGNQVPTFAPPQRGRRS